MKSLNTQPTDRRYIILVYKFKTYLKDRYNIKLSKLNSNLYGYDLFFHLWLWAERGIKDLDKHLQEVEDNFNPVNLYNSRGTRGYEVVNR